MFFSRKDALRLLLMALIDEHRKTSSPRWCDCPPGRRSAPVESERRRGVTAAASDRSPSPSSPSTTTTRGVPTRDTSWGAMIPSRSPQSQHGTFLALICGGGVRRAAVVCGGGKLGGGVRLFSVTSDGTLRGEMKRYVKNMSVFMTDIHIIYV